MACKWPLFCIVVLWKLCLGTFTGATKDFQQVTLSLNYYQLSKKHVQELCLSLKIKSSCWSLRHCHRFQLILYLSVHL